MKRQDMKRFGFHFYDRITPHGIFDFEKKTFTFDQNRTLNHCLESEVLFKFPEPTPIEIVELKQLLDTYDHREWSGTDWSDTNMGVSCESSHGSVGTRIKLESLDNYEELLKKLMGSIERITHVSGLLEADYTWSDVHKVMRKGFEDEIGNIRCPACDGKISFVYDEGNLELHCCGECEATLVFRARGELPNCVRYFGNDSNIKVRKPTKELRDDWGRRRAPKARTVEMRGARAKRVILDENNFDAGSLPTDQIGQMVINHSSVDWWVSADDGVLEAVNIRDGHFYPYETMVHPLGDAFLFSSNMGEFGGGLSVYKRGISQLLDRCNPMGFFDMNGRTFMMEGLNHLGLRSGSICEIKEHENIWEIAPVADLKTAPFCHCHGEGFEYVLTGDDVWRYDGKTAARIPNIEFDITCYYPNNMVLFGGCIYTGMRGGVLQIDLSDGSLTWWTPNDHVMDSIARNEVEDENYIPFDLF